MLFPRLRPQCLTFRPGQRIPGRVPIIAEDAAMLTARGSGEPLVFLPGFCGSGHSFRAQVEEFSTTFRVLTWDYPGCAGTPPMDLMSIGSLALALEADLMAAGVEKAHMVGHAIGGMVLQELAIRSPERVSSAVFFATSPSMGGPESEARKQFLAARLAPVDAGLAMADLAPALMTQLVSPHAETEGLRVAIDRLASVPPQIYRRLIEAAAQFDRRDGIGRITNPSLCITGEADRQAPAAMMERMAAKLPEGRFALVRRAGHEAHLEQPRVFNALLAAFLSDLKVAAA